MAAPMHFGNWQQVLDETVDICENKRKTIFSSFCKLKANQDRVSFVFKHNFLREAGWLQTYFASCSSWHLKSQVEAAFWKMKGNKFFQQKNFALAIEAYTQSAVNAPTTCGDDLSLSYGNRSAALYHLTQYKLCLTDIDRAIAADFPSASLHKLMARRTMALIKLGQKCVAVESLEALKKFVASTKFTLEGSKRDDFVKELNKMEQSIQDLTDSTLDVNCESVPARTVPAVYLGVNDVVAQASQTVTLTHTEQKGRHLLANQHIPRGSTIIVERPFAAVLLPDHYNSHCHHCFSTLPLNCVGCLRCTSVKFCNETCRDVAWSSYHNTECPYLDLLHSVGIAHLSMRVVLCAGLHFLTDFVARETKMRLSDQPSSLGLNKEGVYARNYLTVYDLMTHEESTDGADMLQYSMTAALLLTTLTHTGYFSPSLTSSGDSHSRGWDLITDALGANNKNSYGTSGVRLPEDMACIGGLLLRHILQLVCNAHAITSIQPAGEDGVTDQAVTGTEQTRIATAIYPTASLMNHSCDPTIISSFIGDTLIVNTVKDVSKGQEVYNCYGPHHCRMEREERQALLLAQYRFMCHCEPCREQGVDHRRFGAFKCHCCSGVLSDNSCLECGHVLDNTSLASLRSRSAQCRQKFDNAVKLMDQQNYQAALTLLEKCLKQRREFLYKDHRDLALLQDAIARCYASQGDFSRAADHLTASVDFARLLYGQTSIEYGQELQKQAEVLYNAGRMRECVQVCESCLNLLSDLYPPGHKVRREVTELHREALLALLPQVTSG